MRQASDLAELTTSSRCVLVGSRTVDGATVGDWVCPDMDEGDPFATARLLDALATQDAKLDPPDPATVAALQASPGGAARAAHAYVLARVQFRDETVETFQAPSVSLSRGYGDCDDSERLLVVLARASGVPARFVFFVQKGQPAHVTVQLCDGGKWRWAETTIPAKYGEHPFAAMKRLGLTRADLDGTPYTLQNGQAVALKGAGSMAGIGDASSGSGTVALPSYLGDDFPTQLATWSKSIGADPLDVAALLYSESNLQPTARNPRGFPDGQYAAGINQLAPVNWGYFSPLTAGQYTALTASQQLPYVFAYFKTVLGNHNLETISARDLYWLNFLPATYVPFATDDHVIVSSSSGYYTNNSNLDHGAKGYITAGDLQKRLDDVKANAPAWFASLKQQVLEDTGGVTALQAAGVLALAAVVGVLLVQPEILLDLVDELL